MDNALIQHFTRFYYHRYRVLEGVRAAAFRNVDHLTRVMADAGILKFTTQSSIIEVQDRMIRDQGLEPTPTRRWLLECATFNTWEVYLCLLFAEVESYLSMRNSFALPQLDNLIDINAQALQSLRTLRDKFLHPKKNMSYDQALVHRGRRDSPYRLRGLPV